MRFRADFKSDISFGNRYKGHGGHIDCQSEPGRGTTFKIYLPAIGLEEQAERQDEPTLIRGGSETVLLVDDEESLRHMGSRILSDAGYSVVTAGNGEEALEIFSREPGKIDLVVLDAIMPYMGGKECLENLLRMNPELKVVIASGHTATVKIDDFLQMGAKGFVAKPFSLRSFLKAVRDALDND